MKPGPVPFEGRPDEAVWSRLHRAAAEWCRQFAGKGRAGESPIDPALWPEPGRDTQACFQQGLAHQGREPGCPPRDPMDVVTTAQDQRDMIAFRRKTGNGLERVRKHDPAMLSPAMRREWPRPDADHRVRA